MLSATREVSNESIAPKTASTSPAFKITGKYWLIVYSPEGILREGRPSGIGPGVPILSRPLSLNKRDIGVTTNNARSGEGTH